MVCIREEAVIGDNLTIYQNATIGFQKGFPTIGNISSHQKAAAGQIIASSVSYLDKMEYMLINARVKGGNSGGPVINSYGQVVGTVIQIPFDNIGGAEKGRYDIMGYGMCLPSKYTDDLCQNIEVHQVEVNDIGNCRMI